MSSASGAALLTAEQINDLVRTFQNIDTNADGFVDPAELDVMLTATFPGLDNETTVAVRNAILAEGDRNADGKIDIGEFLALIAKRQYELLNLNNTSTSQVDALSTQDVRGSEVPDDEAMSGVADDVDDDQQDPNVVTIMKVLSAEEIDMFRDAFIKLDRNGDGFVGREEMMETVLEVVGPERFGPLRPYLDPIFTVADKDLDNRLSLTEFLSSFADGPGVVPNEVVNHCVARIRVRLTDEEICTLQESFRNIDKNQDGFIDRKELFDALFELLHNKFPDLTSESFEEIVNVVLATADTDQDGRLNLAEFIRSFQEDQGVLPSAFVDGRAQKVARRLSKEEIAVLKEAFAALDRNNDGFIDYAEMYQALSNTLAASVLDKDQVRDLVDLIMVTADRNKDGRLTLTEFIRNFVENEELMELPVAAARERIAAATARLQELMDSGELQKMVKVFAFLDTNHDGFLQPTELEGILNVQLRERFPEWDDETARTVVDAIIAAADTDRDGRISLHEFVNSFIEGYGVLPPELVNELGDKLRRDLSQAELGAVERTFRMMDSDNDGFVSRNELARALKASLGDLIVDEEHLRAVTDYVMQSVDTNSDGRISIREFILSFELDQGVLPLASADDDQLPQDRPRSPVATTLETASPTIPAPVTPLDPEVQRDQQQVQVVAAAQQQHFTPNRSAAGAVLEARSPIVNDVSGVPISEAQLWNEFVKYDKDGSGWLDRNEFKKIYLSMENFGLEPLPHEVDRLFSKYGGADNKISFEEFSILMLHRARM